MRNVDTAVLTVLKTGAPVVHDGEPPVDEQNGDVVLSAVPYLAFYSNVGDEYSTRVSGSSTVVDVEFQVTYVGKTRDQAKAAGQWARGVLIGKRLDLGDGRRTRRLRLEESQRVIPDRSARLSTGERLYYGVDVYVAPAGISR